MWIVERLEDPENKTWVRVVNGLPNPMSHEQACAYANAFGWTTNTWHRARFMVQHEA